jgi:tetratricopeptide (TPR) repeat protein
MIFSRSIFFVFVFTLLVLPCFSQSGKNYYLVDSLDAASLQPGDKALLDSLLPLYHKAPHDTDKLNILSQVVENCSDDNVWPKYNSLMLHIAEEKLERSSLTSAERKALRMKQADAINNLGFLAINKGETDPALDYFNRSLKINEELGSLKGMASALTNIGYIYKSQGSIEKALEYYDKSLSYFEKCSNKEGIANTLNNIALIYKIQGDHVKALEYYNKSMQLMHALGNKKGMAACLSNIGYIYANKGDHKKALEHYFQALKLDQENEDKKSIATSLDNIGTAYENLGDPVKALDYHFQGLAIYREINSKKGISETMSNIAEVYFGQGKYKDAKTYCVKAYDLSRELGYPVNISNTAELLSRIYEKENNWKEALNMHRVHMQMRDSVFNEQTQRSTLKQQMKYEYEKQEALKEAEHQKQLAIGNIEKKRQELLNWAAGGGFVLVFLFAGFMFSRYRVTQRQKGIIEKQKQTVDLAYDQLTEKNKEMIDSIRYAKRIQTALLKGEDHVSKHLPEHFVLYKPKDIVSGDFYWSYEREGWWYLAAADCTGHGVPGAFLTMLGTAFLNEIVSTAQLLPPAAILDQLRDKMVSELASKSNKDENIYHGSLLKDGMDISLVRYHLPTRQLEWAGANTPLWIGRKSSVAGNDPLFTRQHEAIHFAHISADKQPIGYYPRPMPFTNHSFTLQKDDIFYLFTDGYVDQFGGPKGKKFKVSQLEQLLASIHAQPMDDQKQVLNDALEKWKGDLEQVDDITLIAVKV